MTRWNIKYWAIQNILCVLFITSSFTGMLMKGLVNRRTSEKFDSYHCCHFVQLGWNLNASTTLKHIYCMKTVFEICILVNKSHTTIDMEVFDYTGTKHLNLQRLNLCKKIWQTLFRFFEKFWMIKISCKNLLLCALAENTIIEVLWAPLIYFTLLQSFFRHCSPWTIPKMLRAFFQNLPQ